MKSPMTLPRFNQVNPDRGVLGNWGMDFFFSCGGKFLLYLRHFENMLVYMSETGSSQKELPCWEQFSLCRTDVLCKKNLRSGG